MEPPSRLTHASVEKVLSHVVLWQKHGDVSVFKYAEEKNNNCFSEFQNGVEFKSISEYQITEGKVWKLLIDNSHEIIKTEFFVSTKDFIAYLEQNHRIETNLFVFDDVVEGIRI